MLSTYAIAAYLLTWWLLRLAALRMSKPTQVGQKSPWFTWLALVYCFSISVGFVAFRSFSGGGDSPENLLRVGVGIFIVILALAMDAMSLASLRPLYSLEIAVKSDHTVIRDGAYRILRHPIYLSNILGFLGLCTLMNRWEAWVALPAQVVGFVLMARKEESFLVRHLGNKYLKYRDEVRWMLLPGLL